MNAVNKHISLNRKAIEWALDGPAEEVDSFLRERIRATRNARSMAYSVRDEQVQLLRNAREYLRTRNQPKLTVVEGGNPFCSRPSRAQLTLVEVAS